MRSAKAPAEDAPPASAPPGRARSARPTLLPTLRSRTAEAHLRVESRLFPAALESEAAYAGMLAALLALHQPLEAAFRAFRSGFAALGIDLDERAKTAALQSDLAALAVAAQVPGPRRRPLPDLPSALGAFYVLEGSTLGGRTLLPQVRERLGEVPTDFLAGYGERTGRRWKATRSALVAGVLSAPDPDAAEAALVTGAIDTFDDLDALLDAGGWPRT